MQNNMKKKINFIEQLDELKANSVTPEEFKKVWGYSLEEHAEDMLDYIHKELAKRRAKQVAATEVSLSMVAAQPAASKRAAAIRVAAKRIKRHVIEPGAGRRVAAKLGGKAAGEKTLEAYLKRRGLGKALLMSKAARMYQAKKMEKLGLEPSQTELQLTLLSAKMKAGKLVKGAALMKYRKGLRPGRKGGPKGGLAG